VRRARATGVRPYTSSVLELIRAPMTANHPAGYGQSGRALQRSTFSVEMCFESGARATCTSSVPKIVETSHTRAYAIGQESRDRSGEPTLPGSPSTTAHSMFCHFRRAQAESDPPTRPFGRACCEAEWFRRLRRLLIGHRAVGSFMKPGERRGRRTRDNDIPRTVGTDGRGERSTVGPTIRRLRR